VLKTNLDEGRSPKKKCKNSTTSLGAASMFEFILKLIDAVARFAWAVMAVCFFVLFLPHNRAIQMGIATLKEQHLGYWWILLVFSGTVCAGNLYSRITHWLGKRNLRIEEERKKAETRDIIIRRLDSLDVNEQTWIACCLVKRVQTLYATQINPTANSLVSKGIVVMGPGNITSLPFTIRDFVWEYLLKHSDRFLPEEVRSDPEKIRGPLAEFEASLRRV
jgi:hypothetical protein